MFAVDVTLGLLLTLFMIPFVGPVVGTSMLWDFLDPITMRVARLVNNVLGPIWGRLFMKNPADGFMVNCVILYAFCVPMFFAYCLNYTLANGFSVWLCYIYNVIRIGPHFMNFAYVYTLSHKEGHAYAGMYKDPYNPIFRNVFNWWIGLFYGVLPATFAYGHTRNHHKYNNDPRDVISTGDRPRDNVWNYFAYIPRFTWYAVNISTIGQFWGEGYRLFCAKMLFGSAYFFAFFAISYFVHPLFAAGYVLYPLFENIILLSAINWCWHGFLDPDDIGNEYVGSITFEEGLVNVLNEDYHVVHHQYPSAHWTDHPKLKEKHFKEYTEQNATVFRKTHVMELFFLIILAKYDEMADRFVDLSGKLTREEIIEKIKTQTRTVSWGPLFEPQQKAWAAKQALKEKNKPKTAAEPINASGKKKNK